MGDGQIWTAVSELDGGNFVATKRTTTAYNSDLSQLQVVDNKIYFVYSKYDDNYNEQIWTAIMDLDGSNWSATKRTTSNYSKMNPHMQVVGTKIYYAWYENNDLGNYQIWIASMNLDGSNWSATKKTDTAYDNLDISFQVIDTKIYYAWCGLQADHHRIFTAISDLDGGNWEATERVDTAGFTYTKGIVLQVVDTKIYYTWIQRVVANYKDQIWTAVMNIDGTNWVATQKTTSNYHKASVQLEVVGDKIYYAWEETDGSDYQIWTATMDTDSTDWLAIKRTTSAYDKEFPQLQIVSGIIYYLWDEYDDLGNSQIWITIWNISGNFAYGEWVKFISEVPSHGGGRMLMPPQAPAGGFRILINDGAEYPDSPIVNLKLFGGPDTTRMAISNFSDFRDAEQETYTLTKIWDLCKGFASCPEGEYTVYAKFYAPWGTASEVVSDSITYKKPEEEPEEEVSKEEQPEEKKAEEEILEEEELEEIPGIFPEGEEVPEKVLPEKEMPKRETLQERFTALVLGIISETIKKLKELRENEAIIKVNYQIITPVLVPIALILNTTNFVLTSIPLLLPNFRFILAQLFGLLTGLFRKKRKPWGVVFSTFNQKPLRGVIVRIYEKQTNKLIETQITDIQGRFGFLVGPGQYYIKAQKPGYILSTAKKEFIFDGQQITPYKGEVIDIKGEEKGEKGEGLINVFIPLDPDTFLVPAKRLVFFKLFNKVESLLRKVNPYIFVSGFSFSGFALFVTPVTYNKVIFVMYLFLLGVNIITSLNLRKQYGVIKDSRTKLSLSSAVVRLFNAEYGQLVQERITDQNGRYRFLLSPGTYYLIILKEGYQIFQSDLLVVKTEKAIEKNFELERVI
ncbi:MAG: carboxypeptidase regulatory-like domain-containing protein [Candidatus Nealsonbacteria bacterium]|nr:carboxypeptidase regulatory-like domain-containing protein [Candidatus Nealsonbacteria bacterium]